MKANEELYDFLQEISTENIAKVKANFQFDFNRYQTFYIVDTYDIIEYCFPFIFNTNFKLRSKLAITNFLSYEFFFYNDERKPIILDEYRVEIFNFWFRLKRKVNEFSNYENLKTQMTEKYLELQKPEEKIEFVQSNVGLILSLAFGTISKKPIDRFNRLIKTALQNEELKVDNENDATLLEDIFIDSKPDIQKVKKNFEAFREKVKYTLYGRGDDETFRYLENSLRDIKVFDRIVAINNAIVKAREAGQLTNDYKFFYFSSATKKSKAIESLYLDEIIEREGIANPSLVRSSIEIYLYFLLAIGNVEEYKPQIIAFLEKLEGISKTYSDKAELIAEFRKLFSTAEMGINHTLLQTYAQFDSLILKYQAINLYQRRINEAIETLRREKDDAELFLQFVSVLEEYAKQEPVELLKEVGESIEAYTDNLGFKADIVEDILFLQEPNRKYVVRRYPGTELIRNLPQAFPILLFYNKRTIRPIQDLFLKIIMSQVDQTEVLGKALHPEQLTPLGFSTPEKKLFFVFIRYLFDDRQTGEYLIAEIDNLMILNAKIRSKGERISDHWHVDLYPNYVFQIELVYLKSWILRKNNRHDEAIKLLTHTINDKDIPDDARAFQSRALCYKHKYYKEADIESSEELQKYLKNALKDFLSCEKMFDEFMAQYPALLVKQTMIAVSNSIADTYTKLFLLDKKKFAKDIKKARERINKIKSDLRSVGLPYERFPVYSHTEMDLEYCEAQLAFDKKDFLTADYKVEQARKRLHWIEEKGLLKNYEPLGRTVRNLRKLYIAVYKAGRGL